MTRYSCKVRHYISLILQREIIIILIYHNRHIRRLYINWLEIKSFRKSIYAIRNYLERRTRMRVTRERENAIVRNQSAALAPSNRPLTHTRRLRAPASSRYPQLRSCPAVNSDHGIERPRIADRVWSQISPESAIRRGERATWFEYRRSAVSRRDWFAAPVFVIRTPPSTRTVSAMGCPAPDISLPLARASLLFPFLPLPPPPSPPPFRSALAAGSFAPFRNHRRRIDGILSCTGRSRCARRSG